VFFRRNIRGRALKLGLVGWVRNLPDGRVETIIEGEREKVEKMIKWAQKGPLWARVDKVDVEWQEHTGEFDRFEIKY